GTTETDLQFRVRQQMLSPISRRNWLMRLSITSTTMVRPTCLSALALLVFLNGSLAAERLESQPLLAKPGLFKSLTEPPCSYCSTQHRKNLIKPDDRVLAWIRGAHNGGAIPIRLFLSAPRVINDTYGLFFYDPDGGYVSAFIKDYGYEFHG